MDDTRKQGAKGKKANVVVHTVLDVFIGNTLHSQCHGNRKQIDGCVTA